MQSLTNFISEARDNTPYVCLVSTRNSDCAILLGVSLKDVMNPEQVKALCKDLNLDYVDPEHDFDDDLDGAMPGAVIETGERRIIWYDMNDGTVALYDAKKLTNLS